MPGEQETMNWNETLDHTALEGDLDDFDEPVILQKVDQTALEGLWDFVVREHHYLGFGRIIGGRAKYLVSLGSKLVGAISYCSASYKLGPRDLFVGWDEKTRLEYLPHLINNNRFLILPWIKVHNLASHILSLSLKQVQEDWVNQYAVEPYMAETFIDPKLFSGSCYLAANWTYLGATRGFGRIGNSFVYHGNRKDIYVYIMSQRFKYIFRPDTGRLTNDSEDILNLISDVPVLNEIILNGNSDIPVSQARFDKLLADHISRYVPYLGRKGHKYLFVAVIKGLLSDLNRKTLEPIAIAFAGESEVRNLANFMTRSSLDDDGMMDEYQKDLWETLSHPEGMITGDGYDFPRHGRTSVGVARQYSFRLRKICNCQAGVIAGYSSAMGCGLMDRALFMPQKWFHDEFIELRKKCRVQESLKFFTKNQMMSMMIDRAINSKKFETKYIGLDPTFGDDDLFVDSIPENLIYFAEISDTHLVFADYNDISISGQGRKEVKHLNKSSLHAFKAKDVAVESSVPWREVMPRTGDYSPIMAMDKIVKATEFRNGKPGKPVWLYMMRFEDGTTKYALCNESTDAPPEMVRKPALMRWNVAQCFSDCRDHIGLEQYEVRSWPGWRRHILFSSIAHLFTVKLRSL
jgi:SRSO17 transposase